MADPPPASLPPLPLPKPGVVRADSSAALRSELLAALSRPLRQRGVSLDTAEHAFVPPTPGSGAGDGDGDGDGGGVGCGARPNLRGPRRGGASAAAAGAAAAAAGAGAAASVVPPAVPRCHVRCPSARWAALAVAALLLLGTGAGLRAHAACRLPPAAVAAPFAPHARASAAVAAARAAGVPVAAAAPAAAAADSADDAADFAAAQLDIVYVSGLPQHLRSSLRSLCAFWRRPAAAAAGAAGSSSLGGGTVHLLVPDRMEAFFTSAAASLAACPGGAPPLRLRVWRESAVVPALGAGGAGAGASGTVKQMLLKLAAAYIVETPFYLVMDSDVYARRPWSAADVLLRDSAAPSRLRARAGLDHSDKRFTQEPSWLRESARILRTPLIEATDAYCGMAGADAGPWFSGSASAVVPQAAPFGLLAAPAQGGSFVFGVCNFGRARATHVTPMVLAAAIVREVLVPRLEARPPPSPAEAEAASATPQLAPTSQPWVDVLLAYQAQRESSCWAGTLRLGRFYSWTEYGLYFVAAVAAGALDQYHAFDTGGITSLRYSMMLPEEYEAADWHAIFTDAADDAPFFIVHSWFGKPVERTEALLAAYIPGLEAAPGDGSEALPTPLPVYEA